jgi:Golgi phosphoprotein 3
MEMAAKNELHLYEEVLLLALKDEEGTVAPGAMYQYAVGGAILAELLLAGHIRPVEQRRKKLVEIGDNTPAGDDLLDECLVRIGIAKRRASLQAWVERFAGMRGLLHRVAWGLCRRGILRMDEKKVLLLFTRKVYPEIDRRPEQQLIGRLHEAVFTDAAVVDPRTIVLLSLAKSTGILSVIFDKKLLKGRKKRIEQVVNGEVTGKAAKEAIEAVQAAVMVACMVPIIAASAST